MTRLCQEVWSLRRGGVYINLLKVGKGVGASGERLGV